MSGTTDGARVLRVTFGYAMAVFLVITFDTGVLPVRGSSYHGSLTGAVVDGVVLWAFLAVIVIGGKLVHRGRIHPHLRWASAQPDYEKWAVFNGRRPLALLLVIANGRALAYFNGSTLAPYLQAALFVLGAGAAVYLIPVGLMLRPNTFVSSLTPYDSIMPTDPIDADLSQAMAKVRLLDSGARLALARAPQVTAGEQIALALTGDAQVVAILAARSDTDPRAERIMSESSAAVRWGTARGPDSSSASILSTGPSIIERIHAVVFHTKLVGYSMTPVDEFLERLANGYGALVAELDATGHVQTTPADQTSTAASAADIASYATLAELTTVTFPRTLRGYDVGEVDGFLRELMPECPAELARYMRLA